MSQENVIIKNGNFIYKRNFSGDPNRDRYRDSRRKACLTIPDQAMARSLKDQGFNIKYYAPRDEENAAPVFFTTIYVNYNSQYPPDIFLVTDDRKMSRLDENTISRLDHCWVENVDASLSVNENKDKGTKTLYVSTMYVTIQGRARDPLAEQYAGYELVDLPPETQDTQQEEPDEYNRGNPFDYPYEEDLPFR